MINKDEYKPEKEEEPVGWKRRMKIIRDIITAMLIFVLGIAAIVVFLWGGCWILSYMNTGRTW